MFATRVGFWFQGGRTPPTISTAIVVSIGASPWMQAYTFQNGWGTRYLGVSPIPAGTEGFSATFSNYSDLVGAATNQSPYVSIYDWNNSTGFGSKYADPSSGIGSSANFFQFSPNDDLVAVATENSPYVHVYQWNAGWGTKYSNPSTLPANALSRVRFNAAQNVIAMGGFTTSPYVHAYPWDNTTGFGTKFTDPGTPPTGNIAGMGYSNNGNYLIYAHVNSPWFTAYDATTTGFGTKYANPVGISANTVGREVKFSTSDDYVFLAAQQSPRIYAYPWSSSGWGTKVTNPASVPNANRYGVTSSRQNHAVVVVGGPGTPYQDAYPWTGSAFGTRYANPSVLFAGQGLNADFN